MISSSPDIPKRQLSKPGLLLALGGVGLLGVACWLVWIMLHLLFSWCVTQFWVPTEVKVLTAELVESERSGSFLATATFEYQWNGRQHVGRRVWLSEFRDSDGGIQQSLGHKLEELEKSGQRTTCFVNPRNPEEAILVRQMYSETLTLLSLLTIVAGGIGALLLAFTVRREPTIDDVKAVFPKQPWRWLPDWHQEAIQPQFPDRISLPAVAFCSLVMPANIAALAEVIVGQTVSGWHAVNVVFFALTAIFIRFWLRFLRFGKVTLLLIDREGRSDELSGQVIIEKGVSENTPIQLRLECRVLKRFTANGESDTTIVFPHIDHLASKTEYDHAGRIQAPFRFVLPSGLPNSMHDAFQDDSVSEKQRTEWTLYAEGKACNPRFRSRFLIPVFRRKPASEKKHHDLIHFYTVLNDPIQLLTNEGIIVNTPDNGNILLHVPRMFQWKRKLFIVAYACGILIGAFFLISLSVFMAIIMLAGGVCLLMAALFRTLQSERLELCKDSIQMQLSYGPFFSQSAEVDYRDTHSLNAIDRPAKQWTRPQGFLSGLITDPQMVLTTKAGREIPICHQISLHCSIAIQAMIMKRMAAFEDNDSRAPSPPT